MVRAGIFSHTLRALKRGKENENSCGDFFNLEGETGRTAGIDGLPFITAIALDERTARIGAVL